MAIAIRTEIVLLDVIGFSSLSSRTQHKIVTLLTRKAKEAFSVVDSPARLSAAAVAYGFIPSGDGFFIVLNPIMRGYGTLLAAGLRAALLMAREQSNRLFQGVRISVNYGDAIPFEDIVGTTNFVGSGLNDCARIIEVPCAVARKFLLADLNTIVVSRSAHHAFHTSLFSSGPMAAWLKRLRYRESEEVAHRDEKGKLHHVRFIECCRSATCDVILLNQRVPPPNSSSSRRAEARRST